MTRRVLIAAVVLAVVFAAAALAIRSMLDADVLGRAAASRLSAALGQPVSIGRVSVSLLPSPAVVGSEIAVGPSREAPELALRRVRIVPRLSSLISGPYVIREVTLDGLIVRIVREPTGEWTFPAVVPAPGGDEGSGLTIERVRLRGGQVRVFERSARDGLRQSSSIDDLQGEAVVEAEGIAVSPLRGRVGGASIAGEARVSPAEARVELSMPAIANDDLDEVLGLAASEPPAFLSIAAPAAAAVSVRIDRARSRLAATGSLKAPEVGFYSLRLSRLEAPLRLDGTRLRFEPATFAMYGGSHRGTMVVDLSQSPARWSLDSQVSGVDAGDFLAAMTGRDQRLDGTASATAKVGASVGDAMPRGLQGRVHVDVAAGVIREFPLLASINRVLRLAEGDTRDTRFERASATLALPGAAAGSASAAAGEGYATTDDLVLQTREVRVQAAGRIGFDRSLDLSGIAIVSPERSAEAVRSVRELSGLRNDRGELELPLTISGSLDDPSFGIDLQAVIGRSIKEELKRRIRDLFRRPGG